MSLIKSLKISWLSPHRISRLSFGNISNSKVVNSKTFKPEEGGIFDPHIFGPFLNYECYCKDGYKGKQFEGQTCGKCGTLIAEKNIQRWRGGHITLVSPVTNLAIFKVLAANLSSLLGISTRDLEDIIRFKNYVVLDNGLTNLLKKKQVLKGKKVDLNLISDILQEVIADDKLSEEVIAQAKELNQNLVGKKNQKDYYKILGVKKYATQAEIKKSYQKLLLKYQPDKLLQSSRLAKNKEKMEENFKEINEAYAILGDKKKREKYTDAEANTVFLEDYLGFLSQYRQVRIRTGTEAFRELLEKIDLEEELKKLKNTVSDGSRQVSNENLRFVQACQKNGLKLEWMIIDQLPIIPCGLRPIVNLKEKNTVTMAQIDKLHHKILLTNEGLSRDLELNKELGVFPIDIIHNKKKRLQKVVDQLIYGSSRQQNEIKSLLQSLSGKEGILRHYSLGKRVDYSARSVIVPNPCLLLDQIGIPVKMALTLYKPFLIQKILKEKKTFTVKEAEQLLLNEDPIIFSLLDEVIQKHPVLANRAPSLHRLSVQGFYPQLTLGSSIELHPLITTSLNADFDGDQIAIHLPLTKKSRDEVEERVLSPYHIIDPKNGYLITTLNQDMVLGLYYLTKESKGKEIIFYDEIGNIWKSYEQGKTGLHEVVLIPAFLAGRNFETAKKQFLFTTLGKLIFNQNLPAKFPYYLNDLKAYNSEEKKNDEGLIEWDQIKKEWKNYRPQGGWKKKDVFVFLNKIVRITPRKEMVEFLDRLKQLSFDYATYSGISISPFELEGIVVKEKQLAQSKEKVKQIDDYYSLGFYDETKNQQKKIAVWEECKEELQKQLVNNLEKKNDTSFYHIWDSGARASSENLTQLFAMRGHATNYLGEVIETPITSSLWEGLSPFEFFISVYGAVKGMIDIALKTAQAGDLTRRLVESSQRLTITSSDCQTSLGILLEDDDTLSLNERIYGRYLARDIANQKKEVLVRNTLLLEAELKKIAENKISAVWVRSPVNCELVEAICQKCYGLDLSRPWPGETIALGEPVGIIAAQSLGEPGTQLTMRTFHTGGITGDEDITQGLPKVKQIFDNIKSPKEEKAVLAKVDGEIISIKEKMFKQKTQEGEEISYLINEGISLRVNQGDRVQKGTKLTTGKIELEEYLEIMERDACQDYIKKEIRKVYSSQGIDINEKHIEIFARQMLSRVEILDGGDSDYLVGDIVSYQQIQKLNQSLTDQKKKLIFFKNIISSLKDLASYPNSFLAGISFQNTLKSLVHYSLYQPNDYLRGSKESLIAGQLVPVGTGFKEREKYSKRSKVEE